jgi:energy-coupling factor transport system ATP-binding protein
MFMSIIEIKDLTHIYLPGTPYEKKALDKVSFSIEAGEFVAVVGANGSGKSTLIQHLNGLLAPSAGSVRVCGRDLSIKQNRRTLWKKVGLVFQFPEQQLFMSTVRAEIAYGLKNLGVDARDIEPRMEEALLKLGLDPEELSDLSPLSLSGGNRRLLAIACILAMRPEILILDEPTAGLDPSGCQHLLNALKAMQQDEHTTVIMVSHQVNELMLWGDQLIYLEAGRLVACGNQRKVFRHMLARNLGDLILPDHLRLLHRLISCGYPVNTGILSVEEAAAEIDAMLRKASDEAKDSGNKGRKSDDGDKGSDQLLKQSSDSVKNYAKLAKEMMR